MIKAAVASASLVIFGASAALAQTPVDIQPAIEESIRRDAWKVELQKKLADAQIAQKKGDNFEAAKLYTDCVGLLKNIGPSGVMIEQKAVVAGVVSVRLQLAEQAQRASDFAGADNHALAILLADPKNEAAINFRRENALMKQRLNGMMPDAATLGTLGDATAKR